MLHRNQSLLVIHAYQFTMEVLCKQNILWFQVSMCNSLLMHELQSRHNLSSVKLNQISRQYFYNHKHNLLHCLSNCDSEPCSTYSSTKYKFCSSWKVASNCTMFGWPESSSPRLRSLNTDSILSNRIMWFFSNTFSANFSVVCLF